MTEVVIEASVLAPSARLAFMAAGLLEAWRRPETIVLHDHYWTAAAKHADVVFPATTMLERDDIGSTGRDRYMIAMKKAVEPIGEARDDYAIFSELAERLGAARAYTEGRNVHEWLRHLYESSREKAALYEIEPMVCLKKARPSCFLPSAANLQD